MGKVGSVPEFDEGSATDKDDEEEVEDGTEEETTEEDGADNKEEETTEEESTEEPKETEETPTRDQQIAGLRRDEEKIDEDVVELRKELERKRLARRKLKDEVEGEIFSEENPTEEVKLPEGVDPAEVTKFQTIAKSLGYVHKVDLQNSTLGVEVNRTVEDFIREYPMYSPGEVGDKNWEELKKELKLFARPSSADGYREILRKAHNLTARRLGIKEPETQGAEERRRRVANLGAGGSAKGGSTRRTSKFSESERQHLSRGGFSDEDIAEMETES